MMADNWRGPAAEGVQEADGVCLAGDLADGGLVGPAGDCKNNGSVALSALSHRSSGCPHG
jgi:hypothetical protein